MKITDIKKNEKEYILEIAFDSGEHIGTLKTENMNFHSKFIKKGVSKLKFFGNENKTMEEF